MIPADAVCLSKSLHTPIDQFLAVGIITIVILFGLFTKIVSDRSGRGDNFLYRDVRKNFRPGPRGNSGKPEEVSQPVRAVRSRGNCSGAGSGKYSSLEFLRPGFFQHRKKIR